ncbi:hypothetical protein LTSEADE_4551, partial [Salmonella enterica subsp. enterica serovar Adelaide str. A4-669]
MTANGRRTFRWLDQRRAIRQFGPALSTTRLQRPEQ